MENEVVQEDNTGFGIFFKIATVVLVIWLAYWGIMAFLMGRPSSPGTWGDMFGGLNALFSGLAFAGVIFTILLQSRELELQRKEMERFANAQEKSEKALSEQVQSMKVAARLNVIGAQLQVQCGKGQRDGFTRAITLEIEALTKEANALTQ